MKLRFGFLIAFLAALFTAGEARAGVLTPDAFTPPAACVANTSPAPAGTQTCTFRELDSPSDISQVYPLLFPVGAGNIYISDFGIDLNILSNRVMSNVSDVLMFIPGTGGSAMTAQLMSVGCNVAPGNTSCFPTFGSYLEGYGQEQPDGSFLYSMGGNNFTVLSGDDSGGGGTNAPEPATLGFAAAGVIVLIYKARQRQLA
jgi:hypothetical protein